ncbi:MAG: ROK family protein [Acidimicrobiales bacterium]
MRSGWPPTGLDTVVDNDAKALALGEGARRARANGTSWPWSCRREWGGIVLDGRLLDGAEGNAGHIGHVIVEPEGRACAAVPSVAWKPRRRAPRSEP